MMRSLFSLSLACVLVVGISLCGAQETQPQTEVPQKSIPANKAVSQLKFTVEEAPEWSALFTRTSGWFGGDGIFSIPLNGLESGDGQVPKTLFVFSDTMIGEIKDGKLQPGFKMIHNSTALLTGTEPIKDQLSFYWNNMGTPDAESVFVPKTPLTIRKDYYWLGDGFVNQALDNSLFLFGYRVRSVSDGTFGFEESGNTLIKIKAGQEQPYMEYEQKDSPFYYSKDKGEIGSFGAGVLVNTKKAGVKNGDSYVYVYGVRGKTKKLLVARVLPKDFENYSKWMFWDGTKWNPDMDLAAAVTEGVSNELSVSVLPDQRYALIFQEGGMGRHISMRIGKNPIGPFGPAIRLWDCSDALTKKSYFPYNAKAHPSLSKKGELLISYNVNSFDFFKDLNNDPQLYRPRFIRVKFN